MQAHLEMNSRCFQRNSSALVPLKLPSPMETHFWYIVPDEVKSLSLLNQYSELLSPCERERINRMDVDHEKKKSALLARALVRTTIARYQTNCGMNPRSLKFRNNLYGKPEVEWQNEDNFSPPPLHFNISHTSNMIACGVTINVPIGIDVEDKRRPINYLKAFAQRKFSPNELKVLDSISDPEVRRQEIIKLWTLKEAYVKALGKGMVAVPFKTFTIRFMDTAIRSFYPPGSSVSEASEIIVESSDYPTKLANNWQFAVLEVAGFHYVSICMEKDKTVGGEAITPIKLTVRKTIPFVEDVCVSGTDAVLVLGGLTEQ